VTGNLTQRPWSLPQIPRFETLAAWKTDTNTQRSFCAWVGPALYPEPISKTVMEAVCRLWPSTKASRQPIPGFDADSRVRRISGSAAIRANEARRMPGVPSRKASNLGIAPQLRLTSNSRLKHESVAHMVCLNSDGCVQVLRRILGIWDPSHYSNHTTEEFRGVSHRKGEKYETPNMYYGESELIDKATGKKTGGLFAGQQISKGAVLNAYEGFHFEIRPNHAPTPEEMTHVK
jgi:hypothetical protein